MKKFLVVLLVLIALGGIGGTIYFMMQFNTVKGEKENLVMQNATLQSTIDSIGPTTTAWTVKDGLGIEPGDEITDEQLIAMTVPASSVNSNYILNKSDAIGKFYKVSVNTGTALTYDLIMETDSVEDYAYERDLELDALPVGLEVGDYVSFRYVLPYGEEFVIYEKKRIKQINNLTIKIDMSETDLNIWTSVERDLGIYGVNGAVVYIVKYNEPGVIDATIPFYPIREDMYPIVTLNPNIPDKTRLINEELRKYVDYKLELARSETYTDDSSKVYAYMSAEYANIYADFREKLAEEQAQSSTVSQSVSGEGQNSDGSTDFNQRVDDAAQSIDENIGDLMYQDEETID